MALGRIVSDEDAERAASRIRGFDPLRVTERLEQLVQRGDLRRYFRFRYSRFYGGSAVGDVVGCNLRCVFCWTGRARDDPRLGFWVSPREAARRLLAHARRARFLRLSAGEPTLGWRHLVRLLDELYRIGVGGRVFVLETNGIVLGADSSRARLLAEHGLRPYVRVSVKACNPYWFKVLTGAEERGFWLQLSAIENLYKHGAWLRVAIFAAFGSKRCWSRLLHEIATRTGPEVVEDVEVEPLVLYPTARRRLRLAGIYPSNPELVYEP